MVVNSEGKRQLLLLLEVNADNSAHLLRTYLTIDGIKTFQDKQKFAPKMLINPDNYEIFKKAWEAQRHHLVLIMKEQEAEVSRFETRQTWSEELDRNLNK